MGACNWPVDRGCLPKGNMSEPDAVKLEHAIEIAISVLYALSGRQFGVCPVIARPCPTPCVGAVHGELLGSPGWFPYWDGGNWRNTSCSCGPSQCSASGPSVIHLPDAGMPIQGIDAIVIGGAPLASTEYKLEGHRLYRTGGQRWPSQDLQRPLDEPGTWSVTYRRGNPVPKGVGVLVGSLATEFLAACDGGDCRLPRQVETVTRQGVTYKMIDPIPLLTAGKTGLPEVDLWLHSVNPNRLMAGPRVR